MHRSRGNRPDLLGASGPWLRRLRAGMPAEGGRGFREFVAVLVAVVRLVLQCHVKGGGDSWVIAVNPRHRAYYRKVMGFVPLGGRRAYPAVLDAPAEALMVDPEIMKQ